MPKKKTQRKPKSAKPQKTSPLPAGFWMQVGAFFTIILSLFLVFAWFGFGGIAFRMIHAGISTFIGNSVFILPFVLIFLAVDVFRNAENKLSTYKTICSIILLILFSGFFGLIRGRAGKHFGGMIGEFLNQLIIPTFNPIVAGIFYAFLIFVIILTILQITPIVVIKKIHELVKTADFSKDSFAEVSSILKKSEDKPQKSEIKLNAGVEVLDRNKSIFEKEAKKEKPLLKIGQPRNEAASFEKKPESPSAMLAVSDPNWEAPNINLLEKSQSPADAGDIEQNARIIKDTLGEFNIDVEMESANVGPRVTQYTLRPPSGVKLSRITSVESNIALNLAAQTIRIEAPIPGKRAVGIEVPNIKSADVRLYSVLNSKHWKNASKPLSFAIGKDISGETVIGELSKMPHLLIAGQTGSGKSVMTNTLLTSLLYRHSPSEMKLILVDPKQVEMAPYEDIPHLLTPIINDPEKTISALKWAVNEMERRYKLLADHRIRDIESYNKMIRAKIKSSKNPDIEDEPEDETMPYIVIIIDELADLMMVASRDVEGLIVRLAQKARAVGIHLVLATQRPSVDVITGLIKANVPSRIAFTVASQVDSRTILGQGGAEKLLGQGDMLLYVNGMSQPKRVQGAFIDTDEVNRIMDFLRLQSPPRYNDEIISQPVTIGNAGGLVMDGGVSSSTDDTFMEAVRLVIQDKKASTSYLQRRLRIGYGRAAALIDEMEERGIVGPQNGSKPREVLISSIDEIE